MSKEKQELSLVKSQPEKKKTNEPKIQLRRDDLVFPMEEYDRRIAALRNEMAKRQLDVILVTDPENIFYLTGYQTTGYSYFQALVVPLEKPCFMVTRLLEATNVYSRTWVDEARTYSDTGDAIQTVWHTLAEFHLDDKVIGYEKDCLFFSAYKQERLLMTGIDANFIDCTGIVEKLRLIKSQYEIDIMKKAARATEAGMRAGLDAVQVGATENDIAAEIHHAMFKAGGEYPAVAPYVTSGPRCLIGHATWEGRQIKENECVFLEIGGCYRRYHTAMMRTAFTGKPTEDMLEAERLVIEALEAMITEMRVGMTVHELDSIPRKIISQSTVGGSLLTRSGYSIGIAFAPAWDEGHILSLKPGENIPLEENMTFHIIPWLHGFHEDKLMGISETVRVTKDGGESFFNFDRKLFEK